MISKHWKMVPRNPTKEMYIAYQKATLGLMVGDSRMKTRFQAMWDAAPPAPSPDHITDLVKASTELIEARDAFRVCSGTATSHDEMMDRIHHAETALRSLLETIGDSS